VGVECSMCGGPAVAIILVGAPACANCIQWPTGDTPGHVVELYRPKGITQTDMLAYEADHQLSQLIDASVTARRIIREGDGERYGLFVDGRLVNMTEALPLLRAQSETIGRRLSRLLGFDGLRGRPPKNGASSVN
jgi:hypothetical protein